MHASTTKDNFATTLFVYITVYVTYGTYLTNPTFFGQDNLFQQKHVRIRINVKVQIVLLRETRELSVFRISGRYTKCVHQGLQKSSRTLA